VLEDEAAVAADTADRLMAEYRARLPGTGAWSIREADRCRGRAAAYRAAARLARSMDR